VLEILEKMSRSELAELIDKVLSLRARRDAPVLSQAESALLLKVNHAIPAPLQRRYDELMEKRRGEAIAGPDLEELLRLTEQIERLEAERIEALAKLGQIRGTSLPKLMLELGIQPRPYV
jgi:hypothetical protein